MKVPSESAVDRVLEALSDRCPDPPPTKRSSSFKRGARRHARRRSRRLLRHLAVGLRSAARSDGVMRPPGRTRST
jgi:hypothetical protein